VAGDRSSASIQELDEIVDSFMPEAWGASRLVRAIGRTRSLMTGILIVGWCSTGELRLVRGRDVDRLPGG
jgi:hypothetical protein